jgi:ribonuclease T1
MQFLKKKILLFFFFIATFSSCQPSEKSTQNQEQGALQEQNEGDSTEKRHKKHRKRHKRDRNEDKNSNYASENRADANKSDILRTGNVPEKALRVLKYVRENGVAMSGYVGGRRFGNFEGLLPKKDASGKRIDYQEWDVNPKIQGRNRGTERLITGSDGKGYYTSDHYGSFLLVE